MRDEFLERLERTQLSVVFGQGKLGKDRIDIDPFCEQASQLLRQFKQPVRFGRLEPVGATQQFGNRFGVRAEELGYIAQ